MTKGRLLKEFAQISCVSTNEVLFSFKLLHMLFNFRVCVFLLFSGDLIPGSDVKLTGPVGKEMLMPKDPNATVIMVYPLNLKYLDLLMIKRYRFCFLKHH